MTTTIIAHRGAKRLAPENTLPAFKLATDLGAEGIEADVQLTKDDVPVIIHDERLNRTTNTKGLVNELTLSELEKLDAGSWFSPKYQGTTIPTLEEFLQWIKSKSLYLNLELKNTKIFYKNLEPIVCAMVSEFQLLHRTTFSTFNPRSVRRLREQCNDIDIALLTSKRFQNLVHDAKDIGANALHLKYRLLRREIVEACDQANMALRIYTVNRPIRMRKCFALKANGIMTDIPELALQQRKQFFSEPKY